MTSRSTSHLPSFFKQRKCPPAGAPAILNAPIKHLDSSLHKSALESSTALQPFELMDDGCDDLEETLRQFDTSMKYGPCLGITRLERWERAQRIGLNPPIQVKEILERVGGAPVCLWENRV